MSTMSGSKWYAGLNGRLLMMVGLPVICLGVVVFVSYRSIFSVNDKVDLLGSYRIPVTATIGKIRGASHAIPRYMWLSLANTENMNERRRFIKLAFDQLDKLQKDTETYGTLRITEEAKTKLASLKDPISSLKHVMEEARVILDSATTTRDAEVKVLMLQKMPPFALKITEIMDQLSEVAEKRNAVIVEESRKESEAAVRLVLVLGVLASIGSALFGIIFARKLSAQLLALTERVSLSSSQVASASDQISNASQQLASASQEQASSIEETSASLEEMSGMVDGNLRNAESSATLAQGVKTESERSVGLMDELVQSMAQILESNRRIENLVKVIEEIGEKTAMIDEIVFQTKLLSFNASVEAERAGEHGRGFAVVAQEVGNLAQMSGKSALEISGIVKSSVKDAHEIASDNRERVKKGSELVTQVADRLRDLKKSGETLYESSRQILDASREQNSGIKQINLSVDNLNKTIQETAATAEESASAGEELNSQAGSLAGMVEELRSVVLGTQIPSEPAAVAPRVVKQAASAKVIKFPGKRKASAQAASSEAADRGDSADDVGEYQPKMAVGGAWEKL